MKNINGEEYHFELIDPQNPNVWQLVGTPAVISIYKNGELVTQDTTDITGVNYSGKLALTVNNTINGLKITQINLVNGIPQYVTN
jgi:hypothetical protein